MSRRRKLLVNIILIAILILLVLVSTLLYINFYPRVSLHLISDDALYDTLQIKKNSSVPALKKPEKEGYTFIGWYTDQDCTEPFPYNEAISNDMELYAKYEAIDYTLTYNCYLADVLYSNIYTAQTQHVGDHIWTPDGSEDVMINGEMVKLRDLKEGYTFMGWSTTPNSTTVICSGGGDFLMPASNINLYAMWEPNLYTVSYFVQDLSDNANVVVDTNGFVKYDFSNHKLYASEGYKYSYKMESPASPTHDKGYYTFVGWYLDENFTRPINFDQVYMGLNQLSNSNLTPVYEVNNNAPIILYAKWQVVEFDVLFCLNKESRPGSVYRIADSTIMVEDKNGSILNSDYFKAKKGFYFNAKMRLIDGGLYSNDLLDGMVYYTSDSSVVSHKFLGWYTTKNGGMAYNDETIFNPEDFDRYYTSADAGFEFLRPNVKTYVLYANWEEFYHIKYVYNNKTYDTQPVSANTSGKLRDVMSGIKRDGYYFDGWSRTQSNSDAIVYDTITNYRFITDASMISDDTLYFGTSRIITLYPHWSPNEYHIKYDFSINTLSGDTLVCIDANPQNIVYSEYLTEMMFQNPDPIVRYNYQINGQWESHTIYNAFNDGQSSAKYTNGSDVYLLCGWAIVDVDGKVINTYDGGELISASTKSTDIYKYSQKRNTKQDDGEYDFVIKALWKTQITITFDKGYDDVEGSVPNPIATITGNAVTIPSSPNPTRPYHIFKGWVTADNRTTADGRENYNPTTRYVGRNTVSFGENTVLYASWTPIVYTLNIYNTNTDGARGSLIKQIKMTYAEYSGNVGSVLLGSTIQFGDNAVDITVPKGYVMDGFSLRAGGDVVFGVDTELTVDSKYLVVEGESQTEENLFDSTKSSSASIFVKYTVKMYTVTVNVVDPDGNDLEDFEPIVVDDVIHGTLVGNTNGFIATNGVIANISLPEGVTYDYWEITGVEGKVVDITKCYQSIESDMTITLYTKTQTYDVSLVVVDPINNSVTDTRTYSDVEYGTALQDIVAVDLTLPDVFGFEDGAWYSNNEMVNTSTIVVKSNVTLVSVYSPKQVNITYFKSTDEDVSYTANITYNTSFTLPDQSVKSEFVENSKALSKWTLSDGTVVGLVGTSLSMTLTDLMSQLNKTETETRALFTENEGVLCISFYAVYSTLYSLRFADSNQTFSYAGQYSTVLSYVDSEEIDLVSIVKKYITGISPKAGYVYNNKWQIVSTDQSFDLTDSKYAYTINADTMLMPVIEKQTYSTKFYTVYNDNTEGVLEGEYKDITVQLDDVLNLPTASDVQAILSHSGISYRAIKWYLGNTSYELGASITITSDILSSRSTLSFRLEILQLRTFTYYAGVPGVAGQNIMGATGDVIIIGDIDGTPFDDFKSNTNYNNYISAWKIGQNTYNYGVEYTISDSTPSAFYAVWTAKTVKVVYHQNASAHDQVTFEETHDFDSSFQVQNQANTNFEKSMYRITAWSQNADGTGETYSLNQQLKLKQIDDLHLYAVWTRVYTVIYRDIESGKTHTASDLLYDGTTYQLLSADALSSLFTKEGHYIAKWKYGTSAFDPESQITVSDLNNPSGESITFDVEWGADSLTVTIKYTDAQNNVYGTPVVINTYYGSTLEKNDDIKFDTTRQSIVDTNGIEYRFGYFVDGSGTHYNVGEDGYIEVGVVKKNIVLTTVYVKVLKLTYDLSSIGKTNIEIEYGDGDIIGNKSNPLLTSADSRIGELSDAVIVGWNDGTQNYRVALIQTDSGYNYSKSWTESFEIHSNITLTPVKVTKYKVVIWKDLTSTGEFDATTKEEIYLVEGDVIAREFDQTRYKGFVRQESGYEYNPNAVCTYQNSFSFELTSQLCTAYNNKDINLYPVKYVYITFVITELAYESTFTYIAGEVVNALPAEVENKAINQETVYFDSWINTSDNSVVSFDNATQSNKYYDDITIRAVYRNYYSIQYKLLGSANPNLYNIYQIRRNESNNLMDETTANSIYAKAGKTLIGFSVCYTENNVSGAHYQEGGKTKVFAFGEAIVPSDTKFENHYNLMIFPVYKPSLVQIQFGLGDADTSLFSIENAGLYTVETDSNYIITKSQNEDTISITFDKITNNETRESESLTVSISVDKTIINYNLIAFKFGDENITIGGVFEYSSSIIDATFAYSINSVSLAVGIKYNDEVKNNTDYGYFTVADQTNVTYYDETLSGDGRVSASLTAHEVITSTYITRFVGWYMLVGGIETEIVTNGAFTISGTNNEKLTVTNMVESNSVYAKFVSGFVVAEQSLDFIDYRNDNVVDFDYELKVVYANVATVDGMEYTGSQVVLDELKVLAMNPSSTITMTYTFNTDANWTLWGVKIGDQKIQFNSNSYSASYAVETEGFEIQMIVVPVNVTVTFKGYENADLGTEYTTTYAYNSTINLDNITIPSDVLDETAPMYTFVSWNYDNTPLTADNTTITSNWEKLYKIQIVDTKNSSKNNTVYVIYRQAKTDIVSANGTYNNFFTLNSDNVTNFELESYKVSYKFDGTSQTDVSIDSSATKIYYNDFILQYLDNDVVANEYSKVTDVVITTVYARLFNIVEQTSAVTNKTYLSNPIKQNLKVSTKFEITNVSEEGYTFKGWEFSYVNGDNATVLSDTTIFDQTQSLADIFGESFNDDSCPSSEIKASAVFEINTYSLTFVIPESMQNYGSFDTTTSTFTLNWNTQVSFEVLNSNTNGKATFVTTDGTTQTFELSAEGGNKFAGFYLSLESASVLTSYTFKSDTTIYCKFSTSPVSVEANLTYKVGDNTTDSIVGGYITVGESASTGYVKYDCFTDDIFEFSLTPNAGFSLSTVVYSMGDKQDQVLSPTGSVYRLKLDADCVVNVVFSANTTSAKIKIQNNSGRTDTPFVNISSPTTMALNDVSSTQFATGIYTTSGSVTFKPNTIYYAVEKIAYKLNRANEIEFGLNTARASSDYTYYVDDNGNYVVNYVFASDNIEIVVYLKIRQVTVTLYKFDGSQCASFKANYGSTLSYANISSYTVPDYSFKLSGEDIESSPNKSEAIGGYHFENVWECNGTVLSSSEGSVVLTDDVSVYPQKYKDYKIVFQTNNSDAIYSAPNPNYTWLRNSTISLAGLQSKFNLKTGYKFDGYKVFLGLNNNPSTSEISYILNYNGTNWTYNNTIVTSIDVETFSSDFADSMNYNDHTIYFVPMTSIIQYNVEFTFEGLNDASGSMSITDNNNSSVAITGTSHTFTLNHFDIVERNDNVLTVSTSTGSLKYTITYTPANACKLGMIKYDSSDMQTGAEVEIIKTSTFKAIFLNSDASVKLKFDIDKNVTNMQALALTITGVSDFEVVENGTSTKLSAISSKQFGSSFELIVGGTRSLSFEYSIQTLNGYTCSVSTSGTITFTSENNNTTVLTVHIVLAPSTIQVGKSVDTGVLADKCVATLYYKVPVKTNGIITGYNDSNLVLTTNLQNVSIYLGDTPYITSTYHPAYKIDGVYDNMNTVAGTFSSANNTYSLDTSKEIFYIKYSLKNSTLTFKVQDTESNTYNIQTWEYDSVVISSTDIVQLYNEVSTLNEYTVSGTPFDLNEYFVTNSFSNKSNYQNIMLCKNQYTIGTNTISSYWNLDGVVITYDGITYIDDAVVSANIVSAKQVTVTVNDTSKGYFTTTDKNKCEDYVLFSSTASDGKLNTAIYKVVSDKTIGDLPTITPVSTNDDAYSFKNIVVNSTTHNNWSDLADITVDTMTITLAFEKKNYNITIKVSGLSGVDASITSDISTTLDSESDFNDVLDLVFSTLNSRRTNTNYGDNIWEQSNTQIAVFRYCVDMSKYYVATQKLYVSSDEIDLDSYIYLYNSSLNNLVFRFEEKTDKVGLSISTDSMSSTLPIQSSNGKFVLNFAKTDSNGNNIFTYFSSDNGTTLYVLKDTTVELGNLAGLTSSNVAYLFTQLFVYSNTDLDVTYNERDYKYSHMEDASGNQYMKIFDYDSVTKERTLCNTDGTPENTSIVLGSDVVLSLKFVKLFSVSITLTTRSTTDDAILTEYGVKNWNASNPIIYNDVDVYDGKKIDVKLYNDLIEHTYAGTLYEYNSAYMYKMVSSNGLASDTGSGSFVITSDTTLYYLASIRWTTKNVGVSNIAKYYGNGDYSTTGRYSATIKHLAVVADYNIFENYSGHTTNNLPYVIEDGVWTINSALSTSEKIKWTIDESHLFVGYMCTLDSQTVVIGVNEGTYKDKNGNSYTIKAFSALSTTEKNLLNSLTSFDAIYRAGVKGTAKMPITTYLQDSTGKRTEVADSSIYDNTFNKFGRAFNIQYVDYTGTSQVEWANGNLQEAEQFTFVTKYPIGLGTTVILSTAYSSWYEVDADSDVVVWEDMQADVYDPITGTLVSGKTVSYGQASIQYNNYSEDTDLVLPMNAIYLDITIPTSNSDWTISTYSSMDGVNCGMYGSTLVTSTTGQVLFDKSVSNNWVVPYGAEYTITNSAGDSSKMYNFSTIFTFKCYSILHTSWNGNTTEAPTGSIPCTSSITAQYKNTSNIAVVEDGISGTVLTTFHSGTGGVSTISGIIDGINADTILKLNSYTANVSNASVKVQGEEKKTYSDYVLYYYSTNNAVLYWDKVLYIGTPTGVANGNFAGVGDITVNNIIEALVGKIYVDSDVSADINGKDGTLTLNGHSMTVSSSSVNATGFTFSTSGSNPNITIDYSYNEQAYTFTIQKSSDVPANIGFVSSDILSDSTYTSTYSVGNFTYVSGVTVNKDSIVITGTRYDGCAVRFGVGSDSTGSYIAISFYSSATTSGSVAYTAKVYYNSSSAVAFNSISSTMSGSVSTSTCNVSIATKTYNLVLTNMDTGNAYTSDDYKLVLKYRSDITNSIWSDGIDDVTYLFKVNSSNPDVFTSPFNKTSYTRKEGVDYINLNSYINNMKTTLHTTNACWFDLTYGTGFTNTIYGLNDYSDSTWYRLRGVTKSAGYNIASSQNIRTYDYSSSNNTLTYNYDTTFHTTVPSASNTTHYVAFDRYTNGVYSYDLNLNGTNDQYLSTYYYDVSGSITWNSEYGLSVSNYKTGLSNIVVRSFGGRPSSSRMTSTLQLDGVFAKYANNNSVSYDTTNRKIKLNWTQTKYTVAIYGKEGERTEGTEADIINAILAGQTSSDSFFYTQLSTGSTSSKPDLDSYTRYKRDMYVVKYFTTSNPKNASSLTYSSTIGTTQTVQNGLYLMYPLYIPQEPYSVGLYTYKQGGITGWNYNSTAWKKYFNGTNENFQLLVLPEWNFTSTTSNTAYKVEEISFSDAGYKTYLNGSSKTAADPSNIKYVYIGKYISSITTMNYEATSTIDKAGFYGSRDGIINSTTSPSITRLTWSMYGSTSLVGYIVSTENTTFKSYGFAGKSSNIKSTSILSDSNIWSPDNTEGVVMDECGIGFLASSEEVVDENRLLHVPSRYADISDFDSSTPTTPMDLDTCINQAKYIEPFAFAYMTYVGDSDMIPHSITLGNIKYLGSCAWYGTCSTMATTIEFTSTNLQYIGYQLIDARTCNIDVWFYNNIPFIDNYDTGIYVEDGVTHSHGLHSTALLATYNTNWTSGNITVHYQPDYDTKYKENGLRNSNSAHYLYLGEASFGSGNQQYEQYDRMIFKMIEANASAFVVKNNIIQGINQNNLNMLANKKAILLPTSSGTITGVNYLGQVGTTGRKLASTSSALSFTDVIIPTSYTSVGSILNASMYSTTTTTRTVYETGVSIEKISIGPGSSYSWTSIGDGTYGVFGPSFGVTEIYLPNVTTINNVSGANYYVNNTAIKTITLSKPTQNNQGVKIGEYGLAGLTALTTLNGNILGLDTYALKDCVALTSISYGTFSDREGLSSIADNMAYGSGLTSICLNSDAEYFYNENNIYKVFGGMNKLEQVLLNGSATSEFTDSTKLWTRDGILYGYGDGTTKFDSYLLHVPRNIDLTGKTINMRIAGDTWGANKIATYALLDNVSTGVEFLIEVGALQGIGQYAFRGSNIESITFNMYMRGEVLDYENAFAGATKLYSIERYGGAESDNKFKTYNGCLHFISSTSSGDNSLCYVPENWGVNNSDGGATFNICPSAIKCQALGTSGVKAFDRNKNIKYIVILDDGHDFDESKSDFRFHTSTMQKFEYVSINGAIVYLNFDIETTESSIYSVFYGDHIWSDGVNTYYSYTNKQYVLQNGEWVSKTWTGLTSFNGRDIWTDGTNVYCTYYSETLGQKHYRLDGITWLVETWSISVTNGIGYHGRDIWTDGTNIYYSYYNNQYILNKSTNTWSTKTWSGLTSFDGRYIWTDGQFIYYKNEYILEPDSSYWRKVTYKSDFTLYGGYEYSWTDGEYIYFSADDTTYKVRPTKISSNFALSKYVLWCHATGLEQTSFDGENVWTDGNNTYYSYNDEQYVLQNGEWVSKTWTGLDYFDGRDIWSYGNNIYYSSNDQQYVLQNDTWVATTWTGLTSFNGQYIWTYREKVYYSYSSNQYVLQIGDWVATTWTGLTSFNGNNIWSDGNNVYYSNGNTQYLLNVNTNTWSTYSWGMLSSFDGKNIWSDGANVYYSKQNVGNYKLGIPCTNTRIYELLSINQLIYTQTLVEGFPNITFDDVMGYRIYNIGDHVYTYDREGSNFYWYVLTTNSENIYYWQPYAYNWLKVSFIGRNSIYSFKIGNNDYAFYSLFYLDFSSYQWKNIANLPGYGSGVGNNFDPDYLFKCGNNLYYCRPYDSTVWKAVNPYNFSTWTEVSIYFDNLPQNIGYTISSFNVENITLDDEVYCIGNGFIVLGEEGDREHYDVILKEYNGNLRVFDFYVNRELMDHNWVYDYNAKKLWVEEIGRRNPAWYNCTISYSSYYNEYLLSTTNKNEDVAYWWSQLKIDSFFLWTDGTYTFYTTAGRSYKLKGYEWVELNANCQEIYT